MKAPMVVLFAILIFFNSNVGFSETTNQIDILTEMQENINSCMQSLSNSDCNKNLLDSDLLELIKESNAIQEENSNLFSCQKSLKDINCDENKLSPNTLYSLKVLQKKDSSISVLNIEKKYS